MADDFMLTMKFILPKSEIVKLTCPRCSWEWFGPYLEALEVDHDHE
jgi:hypothetical protein